ncbi:MAG: xanthine dehydrogenase family protein molybdopterin-binding subunit [Magnetospirillum sp.]|nr:xanthine dehydrogenase family protein molybdopterin-binding subunit [Magnetospirillum sp.]
MSIQAAPSQRKETKVFGKRVPRLEDLPLVKGLGRFVADLSFPHQLYMRVVRSPIAHGTITRIDADEARKAPGVVAIWTHADIASYPLIDFRDPSAEALMPYRQPLLAKDRVRYVGEPIAVVFAESAYLAEDAADLVFAEIDELPPHMDAQADCASFAPGISTEPIVLKQGFGDLPGAFANAHCVVELELSIGRHSGVPMECRGAIGRYDAAQDVLELWGAAKVPLRNRETMARYFQRSSASVQLYELHVGGGFGVRGELYPEDFLVCAASMTLGRPVKWIEDRREHLMATNQSREQYHRVRAAVDQTGRILALSDVFFHDQGAYVRTHGARVADLTIGMLPGPYHVPVYQGIGHFRLTNKTPAATYRSPGRYEGSFVRERLVDAIAAKLGLDRIEVRRRNLIPSADMPYTRQLGALGTEVVLDSGDYAGLLQTSIDRFGWDELQKTIRVRRAQGEFVGAGIAMFLEKSGMGPSDSVTVSVDPMGFVEVVTGGASVGQGFETAMAQICAETLGVDYRRIRVVHGQTDRIRFGIGAHASRATVMTGNAVHAAATNVRDLALKHASVLLQAPAELLDIVDGIVARKGSPSGPTISLGQLSRQLSPGPEAIARGTNGLSCEGWFYADHMTYPYGVHLALVRVDGETGQVFVERYMVASDVGRAVNPMIVEGQVVGGVAQGLGGALYEQFRYSDTGQPLSLNFAEYLIPTAHEVPDVEVIVAEDAPSPLNPLGIKGAGEGGCTGVGAAIASAVDDAIGIPGAITSLPITPAKLKALLKNRRDNSNGDST